MANSTPNMTYIGQGPTGGGQILANVNSGPLGRTLVGYASILLDGSTASGTVNFIDGVQTFGKQIILPLQSVAAPVGYVASLTLSAVAASSGGNAVYTGTITGGAANALVGDYFTVAVFVNTANNGVFICTASTATTLTLANANAVAETHAGTAVGGSAAYSSTSAASSLKVGDSVVIAGFSTAANNGTFTVISTTASTVVVNNGVAVAETNPAATLNDVQNSTPVLVFATVSGGTQPAAAIEGFNVSTITSTGFTYVLSANGTANKTLVLAIQLVFSS